MKEEKKKNPGMRYTFDQPIRITAYKPGGLDIMFYAVVLGAIVVALLFLLFYREGHFVFLFTLGRTLLSIPLVVLATFLFGLLKELWVYPRKLLKKSVWPIEDLMKLTGKVRKETERIMTRVLESSFVVDASCVAGEK